MDNNANGSSRICEQPVWCRCIDAGCGGLRASSVMADCDVCDGVELRFFGIKSLMFREPFCFFERMAVQI